MYNILKFDILGHDDPTMIRMLQDLSGVDPLTIPPDDPGVMSLFSSPEILGVTPEQINQKREHLVYQNSVQSLLEGCLKKQNQLLSQNYCKFQVYLTVLMYG
jgi:DNA polymerase III, alpha subunit (gram-positive type)